MRAFFFWSCAIQASEWQRCLINTFLLFGIVNLFAICVRIKAPCDPLLCGQRDLRLHSRQLATKRTFRSSVRTLTNQFHLFSALKSQISGAPFQKKPIGRLVDRARRRRPKTVGALDRQGARTMNRYFGCAFDCLKNSQNQTSVY